jgi:RNA-directed DNA polymerase
MREPDIEGVATHDVPESCGGVREDVVEALTGVHAGWVLSRETANIFGRRRYCINGRQHERGRHREASVGPARSETPCKRGTFLRENREIPWLPVTRGSSRTHRKGRRP